MWTENCIKEPIVAIQIRLVEIVQIFKTIAGRGFDDKASEVVKFEIQTIFLISNYQNCND
jgi:hypothetical protein